jgi:hypothetical protein
VRTARSRCQADSKAPIRPLARGAPPGAPAVNLTARYAGLYPQCEALNSWGFAERVRCGTVRPRGASGAEGRPPFGPAQPARVAVRGPYGRTEVVRADVAVDHGRCGRLRHVRMVVVGEPAPGGSASLT